jgi:hypothetical protein
MRGSVGVAHGSIGSACGTEPHGSAWSHWIELRGVWGHAGPSYAGNGLERTPGSVGPLDRWVQVMDLWFITLGDE